MGDNVVYWKTKRKLKNDLQYMYITYMYIYTYIYINIYKYNYIYIYIHTKFLKVLVHKFIQNLCKCAYASGTYM